MKNEQAPLKSNQRRLYEFIENYGFTQTFLGKKSPKELKPTRIVIFGLYIILSAAFIITYQKNLSPWNVISGIAVLVDAILMVWVYQKTIKLIIEGFHSIIFKKRYELDEFVKNVLGLDKKGITNEAQVCLNLSYHYKKNYYRLEIPLALIAVAAAIIAVIKGITLKDFILLELSFGLLVFGVWWLIANLASSLDNRSGRYFDLYLLLNDMDRNKQYKKLKKKHQKRLLDEKELESEGILD